MHDKIERNMHGSFFTHSQMTEMLPFCYCTTKNLFVIVLLLRLDEKVESSS